MMKKTERWTLKEVGDSVEVLNQREAIGLKGGSQNGAAEYFLIYGVPLPPNTGYNIATNTCYNLGTDNHVITTAGGGGYPGTDRWQSTMDSPTNNNYTPDYIGDAINHANAQQPSQTGDDKILTPAGELAARKLLELIK